jgi:UDP-N-acetylglucosamine 2-epimerase (non-hydrolysing)
MTERQVGGEIHRILSVVGTRPNFMKVAPVVRALAAVPEVEHTLVHTGQHYDDTMSRVFFDELGMPEPDVFLGVGSGSHTTTIARVMSGIEPVLAERRPDVVLVPGDVNSTLAAALAANQAGFRVGHIEAGLRSFDRMMPEETNRILTDQLSDLLFIHSPEARDHLVAEGRPATAIHHVGNTIIDTLVRLAPAIAQRRAPEAFGVSSSRYVLVTLHRPALVDGPQLAAALDALSSLAEAYEVVFPVHPRTRARIGALGAAALSPNVRFLEPLGYLDFLGLMRSAAAVLTDSGGVQEETTFLGIPCFTLRDNTERPVTITVGSNTLLGLDPARIADIPQLLAAKRERSFAVPDGWDGNAAERLVEVLAAGLDPG